MDISTSTALDPGQVYPGLRITASGITVDGRGATVQGQMLTGCGILAEGVSGVTLKNLHVRGFRLGLSIADGEKWMVQDCDFSDNFHDPDFGWGEQESGGGMLLQRVRHSQLRANRAQRVWNACELLEAHDNVIDQNDFSHTSNTALKLWASCRNEIVDNDLSYGIRISPGEVHARDSCGLLVEHGSHDNRFERNDVRHGGDGVFVRVLDGHHSSGNLFRGNDASYANNNCIECAAPGNTFLENIANHGSYGFWLGGSDRTVLIGNEAGWNGQPDGQHNAPEPGFGHGGIVAVNASARHILAARNYCHHNAGGGIVLRGDVSGARAYRAFHCLLQHNRLEANRWGIYLRQAEAIELGPNEFVDNLEADIFDGGDLTGLSSLEQSRSEEEWLRLLDQT